MRKVKGPTPRDMVIPLGLGAGAVVGLLAGILKRDDSWPEVRRPDDPGDAGALLGVFYMLEGAAIGIIIGVVVAVVWYFIRNRGVKLK